MGIFDWFRKRSRRHKATSGESLKATGTHRTPRPTWTKTESAADHAYASSSSRQVIDGASDRNEFIRNKYVREDTGTHETLKILDDSILEDEEEFGADPYNTGRFDRSKSWNSSRSRN